MIVADDTTLQTTARPEYLTAKTIQEISPTGKKMKLRAISKEGPHIMFIFSQNWNSKKRMCSG
jgi:hypothetical protein